MLIQKDQKMLFEYLLSQAAYAHYWILFFFLLAGLGFPISEDILIISAAIISVKYAAQNQLLLFISCYIGAYGSDILCYSLGRKFGRNLLDRKPFSKFVSKKHLDRMGHFYDNHNILTIFFGRFIPFGVRNVIFIAAGIAKTHLAQFMLVDALACLASSTVLFYLGMRFANNTDYLFTLLMHSKWTIITGFILIAITALVYCLCKRR